MRYLFAQDINRTGQSGIVDLATQRIVCWCDENNSKLILEALKMYSDSDRPELFICPKCESKNSRKITGHTKECMDCSNVWIS